MAISARDISVGRPHFSGVLGYFVPRLNCQNKISAGDFEIFRTNISDFIIGGGQTGKILPTFMGNYFRKRSTGKDNLYMDLLKLENLQAILI